VEITTLTWSSLGYVMEITEEDIRQVLADAYANVAYCRRVGGIALIDVMDNRAIVPEGWKLSTFDFYIPPWACEFEN
jgi:hypothetical protein